MKIEESVTIDASPETIFGIWSEVDRWKLWDPDTKEAVLRGPFAVGAQGRIVPTKGRGVPMAVTECTANRSFTVEAAIPLFRMRFDHELVPGAQGTRVTHRVTFSGPLTPVLGRIVGGQVRKGLPVTMQSLKRYAEARERGEG
ncbi:MAG TPA: SRPBCC family protein [Ramlibacter sp.]|jgi:uncharacterized protein YndB with AHSA1/START domain|nr:SRPBCC family protein [Ramlibacter sp.]